MKHAISPRASSQASSGPIPGPLKWVGLLLLSFILIGQTSCARSATGSAVVPPNALAPSSVGPRTPVGPQNGTACPSGAVLLHPTDSVNSIIAQHPAGTAYCFAPGTYVSLQIAPKSGDRYVGQPGATLDGGGTALHAFLGGGDNVTIQNLVIQN